MQVRAGIAGRYVRLVAAFAGVLCALAVAGSAVSGADAAPSRAHAVKIVTVAPSAQHAALQRLDQPQLDAASPTDQPAGAVTDATADTSTIRSAGIVDTARTRGPPVDART
ncbi:MAG: hypothetical protein ACR2LX_04285 [Jatrophihabitans sp.]